MFFEFKKMRREQLEFEMKDFEKNNGKDGKPTYVLADGKVYDVTDSKLWKKGAHMNRHQAGTDLTDAFRAAPHGKEVLERFKQVGEVKTESMTVEKLPAPKFIADFVEKHPFFKRHPHPMIVHFPMTFYITASLFLLFYYAVSPIIGLLDAIIYMHILGTMSIPIAVLTGWMAWKINYLGKPNGHIKWKIALSIFVIIFDVIMLYGFWQDPMILASPAGINLIYPVIIFSYLPIVSIIGYHGGQLVY